MCGNGIRCVGKYLYDNRKTDKLDITVDTLSGARKLKMYAQGGKVNSVCVDMGAVILDPAKVPVNIEGDAVIGKRIDTAYGMYSVTCTSMGNPHCSIIVAKIDD